VRHTVCKLSDGRKTVLTSLGGLVGGQPPLRAGDPCGLPGRFIEADEETLPPTWPSRRRRCSHDCASSCLASKIKLGCVRANNSDN
jgi:hypothetical protein